MKQLRKMSNLIAEELQSSLEERGIEIDESTFEGAVSDIVDSIYEAVEEIDEDVITEEDKFYMANSSTSLGGVDIDEGDFVEIADTDEGKVATIYDGEGNIKEDGITVDADEAKKFKEDAEELEDEDADECGDGKANEAKANEDDDEDDDIEDDDDDLDDEEDEVDEVSLHKRSKKDKKKIAKFNKKFGKKREAKKEKAGYKRVPIKNKSGKVVKYVYKKLSSKEKQAKKRVGKALGKKGQKFKRVAAGAQSGTVTEGFDITYEGMKLALNEGDEVNVMEDGTIEVVREGSVIFSGITVDEEFIDTCIEEGVVEVKEADDTTNEDADDNKGGDEPANEAAILTFRADKGYVLVKEGTELPMGNRIRARGVLSAEGFDVTSEQLDAASAGETITL